MTTIPPSSGNREISATASARGGVVVWNTADERLMGVAVTLDGTTASGQGFGTLFGTATNIRTTGVAAIDDDVLVVAGTDATNTLATAYPVNALLAPRGASMQISLSTLERDQLITSGDEYVVAGVANGEASVARLARDGTVRQQTEIATVIPSEIVPVGLSSGLLVAYSIPAAHCELVRLDDQLGEIARIQLLVPECDNPRFAYAPATHTVLFVYQETKDTDVLVSFRDPDSLAELIPAVPLMSKAHAAQPVWDGERFQAVWRVDDQLYAQSFTASGAPLGPPSSIAAGVPQRGYSVFAFAGATYVPWIAMDGVMRLTRACP